MSINKPSAFAVVHTSISQLGDIRALTAIHWHSAWEKKDTTKQPPTKDKCIPKLSINFSIFLPAVLSI